MFYVAVVYNEHADKERTTSARAFGNLSFVAKNKKQAIKQAIATRDRWQANAKWPTNYKILVGKLTEAVQVPTKYELVKL